MAACLCLTGAAAAPNDTKRPTTITLPPVTAVFTAGRSYPATTVAVTSHKGWTASIAYVTTAQEVRLAWHVDPGGEARLTGRDAWDPQAPWRELGNWGQGGADKGQRGETTIALTAPTLLRLRCRAARWPRSGIASLKADYSRHTMAALHGSSGRERRPVILAEGYDPFNVQDLNDTSWQHEPELPELVRAAHAEYDLDPWLLDWGDGGAPLEQQAEDFAEIARQVRAWNGGRRATVAVGVSMGAVSLRYALAAAGAAASLGVSKYVSINGPQQGAWVNPGLLKFLLKRAGVNRPGKRQQSAEGFMISRGLNNPAAQELLIPGARHDAFYADLRSRGKGGYDPDLPRVAFSNGTLVKEGNDLAELASDHRRVIHRVSIRPLWLPLWLTVHRTYREFKYDSYPGELLPTGLARPFKEHVRLLGVLRFDFKAAWSALPTYVPTHSALDFPEELTGGPGRYRYAKWRQAAFPQIYVAPGRNLPHDQTPLAWIDPRTGKGAPGGENAVLYEVATAFGLESRAEKRRPASRRDGAAISDSR